MQTFYHGRVQQLEKLHDELRTLNQQYLDKDYTLKSALPTWLEAVEAFFDDGKSHTERAEVGRLRTYLATAGEGVNPDTREKMKTGRRALYRTAAFYVLGRTGELLGETLSKDRQILSEAGELLDQLLLSALQTGVVGIEQLRAVTSPLGRQRLWEILMTTAGTTLVARKVKSGIHAEDVGLLLLDGAQRLT